MRAIHRLVACAALTVGFASASASALPPGFVEQTPLGGLDQVTGLAFDPAGRLLVWEKRGRVWIVNPDFTLHASPLLDLSDEVYTVHDHGLLGVAVDPAMEAGRPYLYLILPVDWHYYQSVELQNEPFDPAQLDMVHDTFGRLVRYELDPSTSFSTILPGSRTVLFGADHTSGYAVTSGSHGGDTLVFGQDGTLLASIGDGASWQAPFDVGGPRGANFFSSNTAEADGIIIPAEQVGSYRAQLVNTHNGKVLRIDPDTGDGLPSNPFFDPLAPDAPRSRVWALGFRNPFRISVLPGTGSINPADGDPGSLIVGDVGWNSWEEFNLVIQGGQNFGWPVFEGIDPAPNYPSQQVLNLDAPNPLFGARSGTCAQEFFHFTDLITQNIACAPEFPNPCDVDTPVPGSMTFEHEPPRVAWNQDQTLAVVPNPGCPTTAIDVTDAGSPVEGPALSGRAALGGVFVPSHAWPEPYRERALFADTFGGWAMAADVDASGDVASYVQFAAPGEMLFCTAMAFNPSGDALYWVRYTNNPGNTRVRRIIYDCDSNGVSDAQDIASCPPGEPACADCNSNGLRDDCDIADGRSPDTNANGIPDECETPQCDGDADGDGAVEVSDVTFVIFRLGDSGSACIDGDVDGSGSVTTGDIAYIIFRLGTCPPGGPC